jgi:hypothetical protein
LGWFKGGEILKNKGEEKKQNKEFLERIRELEVLAIKNH